MSERRTKIRDMLGRKELSPDEKRELDKARASGAEMAEALYLGTDPRGMIVMRKGNGRIHFEIYSREG